MDHAATGPCPAGLPSLRPLPCLELARGRVHEIAGTARHSLAALAAGAAAREGPVLWLRPGWRPEMLCPQGLEALAGPGARLAEALILANCPREEDILGAMEEALRAGCVALVLAETGTVPDLRQIRRLHLAAAEGVARAVAAGTGGRGGTMAPPPLAPLGLLLSLDRADSRIAGVESRWALHPLPPAADMTPDDGTFRWRLQRLRARDAPPAQWLLAGTGPAGAGMILAPLAAGD
ncbi:MAG: hypothetical protein JJT95_18720 [Pararhodobacter sp.]|nr:hypothetical protein [Pararhodobacter sp.]